MHVVSNVISSFFKESIDDFSVYKEKINFHSRSLDTGAIQDGPLRVNAHDTLQKYYQTIHLNRDTLVAQETKFLVDCGVRLVLVDATPIACVAGAQAGCVVNLITNFTWCSIYKSMLQNDCTDLDRELKSRYELMIQQCEEDCCCATKYIQLPGACPLPMGFAKDRVVSAPLLAREATAPADQLKRSILSKYFDIDVDVNTGSSPPKILLLGFGGHNTEWHLRDDSLPVGWVCLVLGANPCEMPVSRFVALPSTCYVPDFIAVADAVLSKLGFGFVSECVINSTPLVYVPRSSWPEEPYLEKYITAVSSYSALRMPIVDFAEGNWSQYLEHSYAFKRKLMLTATPTNVCPTVPTTASAALRVIGELILDSYPE